MRSSSHTYWHRNLPLSSKTLEHSLQKLKRYASATQCCVCSLHYMMCYGHLVTRNSCKRLFPKFQNLELLLFTSNKISIFFFSVCWRLTHVKSICECYSIFTIINLTRKIEVIMQIFVSIFLALAMLGFPIFLTLLFIQYPEEKKESK